MGVIVHLVGYLIRAHIDILTLSEGRYWIEHQNLSENVANLRTSRSFGGSPSG